VPAGGSGLPASAETVQARGHFIKMRGRELFKIAVRAMEDSVRRTLATTGLGVNDIDLLVPHQANQRIIDAVLERLGLPEQKAIGNIERYGNTSSASIPISLDECARAGRLKPGDHVSLVAFGGGATWGATLMSWTKPTPLTPERAEPAAAARGGAR
jgi:3-oxoacyl-[acyl-carrier-protein] synthase-3